MSFDIAAAVGTCTLNEDTETTTFGAFFAPEGAEHCITGQGEGYTFG
jgi:hypothetical protein